MRFINSKTHGALDYITALLFIASPWLFKFAEVEAAKWVMIVAGVMIIGLSLLTDYELSAAKIISLRSHLVIDLITGATLMLAPYIFRFAEHIIWPFMLFGVFEIMASLLTKKMPYDDDRFTPSSNVQV